MSFWTVLAGVLCANFLTISLVWGLVTYSRHEREGTAGGRGSHLPALAVMMPLLFGVFGLLIALDRVPVWLDRMLQ